MNTYARWFRWVLVTGIVVNLSLAIPALFAPNLVLAAIRQRACGDLSWGRFTAFLLVLVSLVDIPSAVGPTRYRLVAWLSVFNRLAGIVFFLIFQREYVLFGYIDATFGLPSLALLGILEVRSQRSTIQNHKEVGAAMSEGGDKTVPPKTPDPNLRGAKDDDC